MLKFAPILLAVLYALATYRFSVWRTRRELDTNSTELADPRLKRLTDRLAAALGISRIPVYIYEVAPVNGLAAPDGRIFITRGLYRCLLTHEIGPEELVSVIAHELGHVALGHAKRRMADFAGQNALRTALAMLLGRLIPVVGPWIAGGLVSLLTSRMSRSDEYEADAYAAALLTKAGIGVDPQISMFRKLDGVAQARSGMAPAWLLSHPGTDSRIAQLEQLKARWQA